MPDFVTSTLVLPAVVAGFLLTVLLLTLPFLLATAAAPFLAVAVGFGEAVAAPVLLPLLPPPLLFVLPLFVFPLVVSEEISPVPFSRRCSSFFVKSCYCQVSCDRNRSIVGR